MRILWVSRHRPSLAQQVELQRLFGKDVIVVQDEFRGTAGSIRNRFIDGKFDDLLVVAPSAVLSKLCSWGIHPLFARMELVDVRTRTYRFNGFLRLKSLVREVEAVEPRVKLSMNERLYSMLLQASAANDLELVVRIVRILQKRLTSEELNRLLIQADRESGQHY